MQCPLRANISIDASLSDANQQFGFVFDKKIPQPGFLEISSVISITALESSLFFPTNTISILFAFVMSSTSSTLDSPLGLTDFPVKVALQWTKNDLNAGVVFIPFRSYTFTIDAFSSSSSGLGSKKRIKCLNPTILILCVSTVGILRQAKIISLASKLVYNNVSLDKLLLCV